jgi:hypothetical protein
MEGLTSFLQVGGFVIALLTIYKALSEYGKNSLFQRANVLEKLIEKFKDKKLFMAKRILDDFVECYYPDLDVSKVDQLTPRDLKGKVSIVYSRLAKHMYVLDIVPGTKKEDLIFEKEGITSNLPPEQDRRIVESAVSHLSLVSQIKFMDLDHLLRTHKGTFITDDEVFFRDSFDELLDFYLLLIYYLRNEIITIREVHAHFLFHLLSVKNCEPLNKYISIYYDEEDFKWLFRQLKEKTKAKSIGQTKPSAPENLVEESLQRIQAIVAETKNYL